MGFENDHAKHHDQPAVANQEVSMKPKITYAANFLLSLRESDLCKKLPSGFDESILNVFHDTSHFSQEKTRTSSSFAAQNFRQNEYSASPPAGRDVNSYSRGPPGKWESRSRDGESQTNRDSDSGRQFGNQSRRPWQNLEHDGLLGSGSSPKLTGYTSGTSAPKFRSSDLPNLNKSSGPYQPPRPFKAVPHNRITTNDLRNDETFGSTEIAGEDKAEQERKRRAEFELMRNEQHKSGQENQYLSSVDSKDGLIFDSIDIKGNLCGEKKIYNVVVDSLESSAILAPKYDSVKSATSMHTAASRPVVPPGFGNTSSVAKSTCIHDSKVQTSEIDDKLVYSAVESQSGGNSADNTVKKLDDPPHHDQSDHSTNVELLVNGEGLVSNQDFAASFLEDAFSNPLTMNGGALSKLTELPDGNLHDNFNGSTNGSSKFAHWFAEGDGKRQEDCHVSEKPANLFSLIGGPTGKQNSNDANAANTSGTSVSVLTCEDLEQSILSELGQNNGSPETLHQGSTRPNAYVAQPKAGTDALASQHLLSVLQKEPVLKDMTFSLSIDGGPSNPHDPIELSSRGISTDSLKQRKVYKTSDMGKNPTLEMLFGSAFMEELQVNDAPISTKNPLSSDYSRFQLPDKENLINGSYPLNSSKSLHGQADAAIKDGNAASRLPVGNTDRLGALSAMFRDGRSGQVDQAFHHNHYEKTEHSSAYHGTGSRPSPPQFPSPHMNQGRPMFSQLQSNRQLPQTRLPENMIQHDQPLTHPFSTGHQMFHQPRQMEFDPSRQQPIMQHAHLPNKSPPLHLLRQYSGNLPQSSHPYNQIHGFRQELDTMQGFRFHVGHQQPGFGSLGISPPVTDIGLSNHHPDVIQSLRDAELRSKEKQKYPFPGHLRGLQNF